MTAIVILNWNGLHMLQRFLPSVLAFSPQAEVVVADNGSTDASMQWLEREHPSVRRIMLGENLGFAEGYNRALQQVDADMYLLLNSDVAVTEGWLTPLLSYMETHPEVAACQPKLRCEWQPERFEYAGACGGFIDALGYPYCRGRLMQSVERDEGQYDEPLSVLWATGAALLIRAQDYWAAGGLDGRFFAHQEEIDLCWRLRSRGRGVVCVPQSVVFHVGGGTLPKDNPRKTFLNFRNNLLLLYKNLPERELYRVMCMRWLLDYVAAFQTLVFNRNVGDFKAIYRARRDFRKWLPQFRDDRRRIQRESEGKSVPTRVHYSILYKYYLKRKKYYSEIK